MLHPVAYCDHRVTLGSIRWSIRRPEAPMTVAVILATGRAEGPPGVPAGAARLRAGLATVNVPDVIVIGRPGAGTVAGSPDIESPDVATDLRRLSRLARRANVPVVILPADLLVSTRLLDRLVNGTRAPLAAVTVPPGEGGTRGTASARVRRGRVVHVGAGPKANAVFPGVLRFDASEGMAIANLAGALADLAGEGTEADAAGLLLAGLLRSGRRVAARSGKGEVCRRVSDDESAVGDESGDESGDGGLRAAQDRLKASEAEYEEHRRLVAAVRSDDGFFATFAVNSYSPFIVRRLARWRVTPNTVTGCSAALAALAALWFSAGTRLAMITGAVLLYLAFVLDCVDGQLARYTRCTTELGAWLDEVCDRGKEYAVYVGLAIGSTAAVAGGSVHGGDVWALAVAALVLQSVRHMVGFSYRVRVQPGSGTHPAASAVPAASARKDGPRAARLARRLNGTRGLYWFKKILVLPIGERFALIALTAALFDPRVTFLALLVWGSIAAAYTLTGRLVRAKAA
jgi:phosphatidylglycerophosphate synthase